MFHSRPVRAALLVALGALCVERVPALRERAPWHQAASEAAAPMQPSEDDQVGQSAELGETRAETVRAEENAIAAVGPLPQPIAAISADEADDDPGLAISDPERSLDAFFEALARTTAKAPGAVTRILFHGDSMAASDFVTSTLRRSLQRQFGDAGHGFVLMANAWPSYFHNDIFRYSTGGYKVSRVVGPYAKDGFYGLGGVSFDATTGVSSRFGTVDSGDLGRAVSEFRLLYMKQPGGGLLEVRVDDAPSLTLDTRAETPSAAHFDISVADGPHRFEVITRRGTTRTFGVILERKEPGVVLDVIGIQGARMRFLDKQDDAHWAEQLQLRDPDLIVYQFGANESGDGFAVSMPEYHATMKAVLDQAKRAVPRAGCLLLGAMDRARKQDDQLITVPIIPHIVREQEATAREAGCAFWNTYEAMDGRGSMAKWVRRGRGQADLTHPTGYGAEILGRWIYGALIRSFNEYRSRSHSAVPPAAPQPE